VGTHLNHPLTEYSLANSSPLVSNLLDASKGVVELYKNAPELPKTKVESLPEQVSLAIQLHS